MVNAVTGRPRLGFWSVAALVVGHTTGIGIFLTPAQLIGARASPALTLGLWLVVGALVVAGAWTFGELAARYPRAGGLYVYLDEAWGRRVAFLYGWQCLLVMDPGIIAALALGLSGYLAVLFPATRGHETACALSLIWLLAFVQIAGLQLSSRVLNVVTTAKVLAFIAFVVCAFALGSGTWTHLVPFAARRPDSPPLHIALALALTGMFYSYGGFWEASRVAGEVRDVQRDLPRALAVGVTAVTAIYVAITLAFLYLVPGEEASSAAAFAERAGRAIWGGSGPAVLASIVVLSGAPSMMALLFMAPRLYIAMSEDGLFPRALASLTASRRAPWRATALLAAIASLFVLSGSFGQILAVFLCTAFVFLALAAAGLFVLRRKEPDAAPFSVPGYPVTPLLFVVLTLAAVGMIATSRPWQALIGFGLVLAGWPVYGLVVRRRSAGTSAASGGTG
ncbi:MAG TPA: amino acid permease [Thermoanaerobaculia bacterium]